MTPGPDIDGDPRAEDAFLRPEETVPDPRAPVPDEVRLAWSAHSQTLAADLEMTGHGLERIREAIMSFEKVMPHRHAPISALSRATIEQLFPEEAKRREAFRTDPAIRRRHKMIRSIEAGCWRKTKPITRGVR